MNALLGASQSSRRFESMQSIVFDSVSKAFRHRPALFNWMGRERKGETQALDDLSLSIPPRKILVLLGPNGSGKTTTLKLISTMLLPDSGRVLVEGSDTRREGDRVRRDRFSPAFLLERTSTSLQLWMMFHGASGKTRLTR